MSGLTFKQIQNKGKIQRQTKIHFVITQIVFLSALISFAILAIKTVNYNFHLIK